MTFRKGRKRIETTLDQKDYRRNGMSFIGKDNDMRRVFELFLWLAAAACVPFMSGEAYAGEAVGPPSPVTKEHADDMVEGEVLKVDRDFARVIIKHHALVGLGMPAMTMVFNVPDTAVLDSLQAGAHIKFIAQVAPHGLAITKIESVRD